MDKPLLVLGATSGIGKLCMETALGRGLRVRAFAQSADSLPEHPLLERVASDALNAEDVRRALEGAGCSHFCTGNKRAPGDGLGRGNTVFLGYSDPARTDACRRSVASACGYGVRAGRSRASMSAIERLGHSAVLGRVYADKTRQEKLIEDSDCDWTIARPVILNNRPASGRIKVLEEPSTWRKGLISRGDVAAFLVDAVEQEEYLRKDVVLAR